jgi:hypothetical protein
VSPVDWHSCLCVPCSHSNILRNRIVLAFVSFTTYTVTYTNVEDSALLGCMLRAIRIEFLTDKIVNHLWKVFPLRSRSRDMLRPRLRPSIALTLIVSSLPCFVCYKPLYCRFKKKAWYEIKPTFLVS